MRNPIILHRSTGRQLLGEWLATVEKMTRDPRGGPVTVVPSPVLAGRLRAVLKRHGVHGKVLTLETLALSALPSDAQLVSRNMAPLLGQALAPHLLPQGEILGIRSALIDGGLELREQGIRRAASDRRVDWSPILDALQEMFTGPLFDLLRLYQYAARSPNVLSKKNPWLFYGFISPSAAEWTMLEALAKSDLREVWIPSRDDAIAEPWNHLVGASHLHPREDGPDHVKEVPLSTGEAGYHRVRRIIEEARVRGDNLDDWLVIEGNEAFPVSQSPEEVVFRRFMAVSEGQFERPSALYWCEQVVGPAPSSVYPKLRAAGHRWRPAVTSLWPVWDEALTWAEGWGRRLDQVSSWQDVYTLVQEAARYHDADWTPVVDRTRAWKIGDGLRVSPDPAIIRGWLDDALWTVDRSFCGIPRVSLMDAMSWGARTVIVDKGSPSRPSYLLPPGVKVAKMERSRMVLDDLADEVWQLSPEGEDIERETGLVPPGHRSARWYQAWRDDPEFNAYSGHIEGDWVRALSRPAFSPSSLESFGRCPQAYVWSRLLGLPGDDTGPIYEVDASLLGQWAHRVLQWAVQEADRSLEMRLKRMPGWVDRAMAEIPPVPTVLPLSLAYARESLISQLSEALRHQPHDQDLSWLELELHWTREVLHDRWALKGRIDRLDRLGNGSFRLIDYKTGSLKNPNRPQPDNLQLALYRRALEEQHGQPVSAELVGVSQKNDYRIWAIEPEQVVRVDREVDAILEGIAARMAQGAFFPAPDPKKDPCRSCGFRTLCPGHVLTEARRKGRSHASYVALWTGGHGDEAE